jgi:hypothetical protein
LEPGIAWDRELDIGSGSTIYEINRRKKPFFKETQFDKNRKYFHPKMHSRWNESLTDPAGMGGIVDWDPA